MKITNVDYYGNWAAINNVRTVQHNYQAIKEIKKVNNTQRVNKSKKVDLYA